MLTFAEPIEEVEQKPAHRPLTWTPEMYLTAKAAWARGASLNDICNELHSVYCSQDLEPAKRFNGVLTRSAVMGVISRARTQEAYKDYFPMRDRAGGKNRMGRGFMTRRKIGMYDTLPPKPGTTPETRVEKIVRTSDTYTPSDAEDRRHTNVAVVRLHERKRIAAGDTTIQTRGEFRDAGGKKRQFNTFGKFGTSPLSAPADVAEQKRNTTFLSDVFTTPVKGKPKSYGDLKRGECKWPIDQDGETLACAQPSQDGKSYCAYHAGRNKRGNG